MRYAKELTLRLANRSGLLAEITSALWRKGINIHAFSAELDGRDGTLHLIVDKFTVAKKTLVENGWEAAEEKVLVLTLVDKPGSLAFIASKLAEMGINIRHAYAGPATREQLTREQLTRGRSRCTWVSQISRKPGKPYAEWKA